MTAENERGEDTSWITAPLCASLYLCKANSIRVPLWAHFCCGGSGVLVARVHLGTSLTHTTHTHAKPALHCEFSIASSAWFYANKRFFGFTLLSTFPPAIGIYTKLNAGTWTSTPLLTGISFPRKKSNWSSQKFAAERRAARRERNRNCILPPNLTWP